MIRGCAPHTNFRMCQPFEGSCLGYILFWFKSRAYTKTIYGPHYNTLQDGSTKKWENLSLTNAARNTYAKE